MRVVSLLFHDVFAVEPVESGFRSPAADRYKLSIPDFEAHLDELASADIDPPLLSTAFAGGDRREETTHTPNPGTWIPTVITVDDGGQSYYTVVAPLLEELGWRGHCFVTTKQIGERGFLSAAQIRELDRRGHVIGTHSASHPARFSALSIDEMHREWAESRVALEDVLGRPVSVGSVPGGYFSTAVATAAATAGLNVLFTSEPTTRVSHVDGCAIVGRFTIRPNHRPDIAVRLIGTAPWTRYSAWISWNLKALVKSVLGASYTKVADWLFSAEASANHG